MRAARYRHSCKIYGEPTYNENTGLMDDGVLIYDGVCLYQEQDNMIISGGMAISSPNLFLPLNDALFAKGLKCIITATKGRVIEAYIDNFVDYEGVHVKGTQIMLKQSNDA